MDVVYACCAGLDVHQKSVVACRRIGAEGDELRQETPDFQNDDG